MLQEENLNLDYEGYRRKSLTPDSYRDGEDDKVIQCNNIALFIISNNFFFTAKNIVIGNDLYMI